MCEKSCPVSAVNSKEKTVDNERCIECFRCINECRLKGIKYGIKPKSEVKFNIKRRETVKFAFAVMLFASCVKIGSLFLAENIKKIKEIIVPPGAKNAQRMLDKCLNCNLCINSCPNKILSKANDKFGAVHIDYTNGKKYCDYDCNRCSNICPSGAIKKLNMEEKQNTRIAMASIDETCLNCGNCINECPKGAIKKLEGKVVIDGTKCIGCAKCYSVCPKGAIKMFSIKEQETI